MFSDWKETAILFTKFQQYIIHSYEHTHTVNLFKHSNNLEQESHFIGRCRFCMFYVIHISILFQNDDIINFRIIHKTLFIRHNCLYFNTFSMSNVKLLPVISIYRKLIHELLHVIYFHFVLEFSYRAKLSSASIFILHCFKFYVFFYFKSVQ